MQKISPYILVVLLLAQSCGSAPEKVSLLNLFVTSSKADSIDYYIKELGFETAKGGDAKKNLLIYQKTSGDTTVAYYTENNKITYGSFKIKNFKNANWRDFENHIKDLNKFERIEGNVLLGGKSYHIPKEYDLYIEIDNTDMFMEVFVGGEE